MIKRARSDAGAITARIIFPVCDGLPHILVRFNDDGFNYVMVFLEGSLNCIAGSARIINYKSNTLAP